MAHAAVAVYGRAARRSAGAVGLCRATDPYRAPAHSILSWPNLLTPAAFLSLLFVACAARAEYCVDWSAVVQRYSGSTGHCWATREACRSYYNSRSLSGYSGDFSGGCYYRPGKYPRAGAKKSSGAAQSGGNNGGASAQQRFKAEERSYDAAQQRQFQSQQRQLLQGLKGPKDVDNTPAHSIVLKPPPASEQPTGIARKQLDCIVHKSGQLRGGNWEQKGDCSTVTPEVPAVSPPAPVKTPSAQH